MDTFPQNLSTPEFRKAWSEYLDWRAEMGKAYRWKKAENTKKRWLKKLSEWGHNEAISALEHCMINEYSGLFPAPYKSKKLTEQTAEEPAKSQPDERWRDMLKTVLKDSPEYAENGWDEQKCLKLGWYALPYSLRAEIKQNAFNMGIKLRL